MEKLVSFVLIMVMLSSSFTFAYDSKGYSSNALTDKDIKGDFIVKEISFQQIKSSKTDSFSDVERTIMVENRNIRNLESIKNFVKSQKLESYGLTDLEDVLLNELEELKTDSGYIENYKLYIPAESKTRS